MPSLFEYVTIEGSKSAHTFRLDTIEQVHAYKGDTAAFVVVVTSGGEKTCIPMFNFPVAKHEANKVLALLAEAEAKPDPPAVKAAWEALRAQPEHHARLRVTADTAQADAALEALETRVDRITDKMQRLALIRVLGPAPIDVTWGAA